MSEFLTGRCPNCASKVEYTDKDTTVMCLACDSSLSVSQLTQKSTAGKGLGGVQIPALMGFDNPESGVVFLENFFETYDWTEYQESDEIVLRDIVEVIQNNKIKNGAAPQSWYLDFKGLSVPVAKKLEGLAVKATEMGEKYNPEDDTESLAAFDIYRKVAKALVAEKDEILKHLEIAIAYAEKFGLDADKLAEIRKELADLRAKFKNLKEVKDISEIGEYVKAQEKVSEAKAKEFAAQGIDAKEIYQSTVKLYGSNTPNKNEALRLFESIRGYRDSVKYINKINKYYDYFSEMFYFGGKYYLFKEEDFIVPALNVGKLGKKKKAEAEEQEETIKALSLYEVVNGICAEKPILKGVEQIIKYYNSKLYFFKKNQGVFYFDLNLKIETCVDKGNSAEYMKNGAYEVKVVLNGTALAVKKKLHPVEKKGCRSFFKKKDEEKLINNYQLILVDLMTGESRVVIPEMVDIAISYDKEMFYIVAERVQHPVKKKVIPGAEEEPDYKTTLLVCDLTNGQSKSLLGEDCDIHTVVDKKIVYSLWKPNKYNKDLHVYDMETETDVLVEDNICDFKRVINGKLYYTVGNVEFKPLVSNSFDGTDRKEIMKNAKEILAVRGNWLYIRKGWGKYSAIVKISTDGETKILLCTQIKRVVLSTSTHIYYVDTNNSLHVVRTDGKENKILAEDVGSFFVVADTCMYYARNERVSADEKALSIYRMDKDGNNAKKLVFNVKSVSDYDENRFYYKKEEDLRYKLTIPTGKKEPEERIETYTVSRYFAFDKASETSELVLTQGLPHEKSTFSTGCLRKKVDADVIYEELPSKCEFKYRGLADIGQVEAEYEEENENKPNNPVDAVRNLVSNNGNGEGCGCASLFKKNN